jgi:hypothetical protein
VAQFCRPGRSVPSRSAHAIYLAPVGSVTGAPPARTLIDFLRATFGLDVKLLVPELPADAVAALSRSSGSSKAHGMMLHAGEACDLLHQHKPRDAFAVLGYTMEDLLAPPTAGGRAGTAEFHDDAAVDVADTDEATGAADAAWGFENAGEGARTAEAKVKAGPAVAARTPSFTFSEVQPLRAVGIVSFARYGGDCTLVDIPDAVAFAYICRSVGSHATLLRRCTSSIGQACGRLLGMGCCVHGRCLLNGAIHLGEVDARPLLPCPIELKKLATVLDDAARAGALAPMGMAARLAARMHAVRTFLSSHGFADGAAECEQRLRLFEQASGSVPPIEQQQQQPQVEHGDPAILAEMERAREAVRRDAAVARELALLDAAPGARPAQPPPTGPAVPPPAPRDGRNGGNIAAARGSASPAMRRAPSPRTVSRGAASPRGARPSNASSANSRYERRERPLSTR